MLLLLAKFGGGACPCPPVRSTPGGGASSSCMASSSPAMSANGTEVRGAAANAPSSLFSCFVFSTTKSILTAKLTFSLDLTTTLFVVKLEKTSSNLFTRHLVLYLLHPPDYPLRSGPCRLPSTDQAHFRFSPQTCCHQRHHQQRRRRQQQRQHLRRLPLLSDLPRPLPPLAGPYTGRASSPRSSSAPDGVWRAGWRQE